MIYFLSDAHLGSRMQPEEAHTHEQEKRLCRMLRHLGQDAAAIYMVGDMIDFWFEYASVVPKGFARFLGTLSELTDNGIEVHYFTGNHDMWTYGYLEQECGVKVHKKAETLTLNGKRIFLAHGDGLNEHSLGVKIIQWIFHSKACKKLFCLVPTHFGIQFGLWWSAHNRKHELLRHNRYYGEDKEFLVLYAKDVEKREHHDYYIFGHRHILLDLMLAGGARVVILGDCITEFSYAALDKDGNLSIHNFEG